MTDFKTIERHPKYEISKTGVIRHSETKRVLKPTPSFNGHLRVKLDNKTEYVGRLVAEAYCPKMDDCYTDVRYVDGDKNNLRADNIEWATHHQTQYDSFGTSSNAPGGRMAPKPILDTSTKIKYPSIRSCARDTNISPVNIRRMIKRGIRFRLF